MSAGAVTAGKGGLVIEANRSTGTYTVRTTGNVRDSLEAQVAAEVDHTWLHSRDYPIHETVLSSFSDDRDVGPEITVAHRGLAGQPDLLVTLRLHTKPEFAEIAVAVRNRTVKEHTVQAIRVLEAGKASAGGSARAAVYLNGPARADRVLSDSFSEALPSIAIHDLSDTKSGVHRAVGSQLVYNQQSHQGLFLGALTSERWMTVLRLRTGAGGTRISRYEVDSTGTTELTQDYSLRRSGAEDRVELSLPVAAGASLFSERLMVTLGGDYHAQLESYGEVIRKLHHARVLSPTPMGWWSWTAYFFGLNQSTALTNAQWLSEHLSDLGYTFFHIDEGYQYARGDYVAADAARFPDGMAALESKVRGAGLTPGLWTAPFEVSVRSAVYENHKDWLVRNANGEPIHVGFVQEGSTEGLYVLDATNPEAQSYLRSTYATLVKDWGIRYIKLDFMEDSAVEGRYYRPNTTAMEAQRTGLQIIRDTVGPEVLLDKDGSPMLNPVGLVDIGRISADTGHRFELIRAAAPGIAARYYMNRNFFVNDPDAFTVSRQTDSPQDAPLTLDEARVSIALAVVAGGMFEIGDDLPTLALDGDRLALVRNPELLRMARWGHASTPLDLMTYPAEQGMPSVFVLREGAQRATVTLFNWSDKPFKRSYEVANGAPAAELFHDAFGLTPGSYRITDVFDGLGPLDFADHPEVARRRFTLVQPPHSVRMLRFEVIAVAAAPPVSEVAGAVDEDFAPSQGPFLGLPSHQHLVHFAATKYSNCLNTTLSKRGTIHE